MEKGNNNINQIQKEIGILATIVGIVVTSLNLSEGLTATDSLLKSLLLPGVWAVALPTLFVLYTCFYCSIFSRVFQIITVFLVATISIWDNYNSVFGLGLVALGILLLFKYGFLKKKFLLKAFILATSLVVWIYASAINSSKATIGAWLYGLDSIFYLVLFIGVCLIIYRNEISNYISQNKIDRNTIQTLNIELSSKEHELTEKMQLLKNELGKLENEYKILIKPIDLEKKGLTPREKVVLENLMIYRETEDKLGERLGITRSGVRGHLANIRKKLGVERREELLELCRNNFK
ncbi:MAG: hypothetical protein GY760_08600 [Deltaproteobacteria bacterium]|nr:hypothetical protein [Deltaproteobacteria bacterium]